MVVNTLETLRVYINACMHACMNHVKYMKQEKLVNYLLAREIILVCKFPHCGTNKGLSYLTTRIHVFLLKCTKTT